MKKITIEQGTNLTLENIWQQYQRSIYAFLQSKINNAADIDDIQQEILLKTHQNLHTIQQATSVKSWLFQIANRTIIDFYRQQAKRQSIHSPILDGKAFDDTAFDNTAIENIETDHETWAEKDQLAIKHDLSQCLTPFIQALPSEQSELLRLVELDEVSQKKIAEQQGISYSTLKSRVQKSRNSLKNLYEQCCHFTVDKNGKVIDYEKKSVSHPTFGNQCNGNH